MDKIILALDVDNLEKAKGFVDKLFPEIKIFKVGSQLFTLCGPGIVEYIHKKGAEVFLDLKFHDIPNTVANAVRAATRLKVKMLTVHASGGEMMLKAAVEAAGDEAGRLKISRPLLLGVTVLTSQKSEPQEILRLARLAQAAGLNGVISSVHEAAMIRKELGKEFIIVTPGIRPKGYKADDQSRVATAEAAFSAGADFIVVGRPILEAADPLQAVKELV
ncbi:MAG: orotidine-5'-phosphate decarboxylase [Candidatus Omnitrophica bacterium]|nr:orotidine-5'-phosphate decarboxylase [Candidatus Omnitrophota bacterium]